VRDKYFVDCLVLAVRSSLQACRRKWGVIRDSDSVTATDSAGVDTTVYSSDECRSSVFAMVYSSHVSESLCWMRKSTRNGLH